MGTETEAAPQQHRQEIRSSTTAGSSARRPLTATAAASGADARKQPKSSSPFSRGPMLSSPTRVAARLIGVVMPRCRCWCLAAGVGCSRRVLPFAPHCHDATAVCTSGRLSKCVEEPPAVEVVEYGSRSRVPVRRPVIAKSLSRSASGSIIGMWSGQINASGAQRVTCVPETGGGSRHVRCRLLHARHAVAITTKCARCQLSQAENPVGVPTQRASPKLWTSSASRLDVLLSSPDAAGRCCARRYRHSCSGASSSRRRRSTPLVRGRDHGGRGACSSPSGRRLDHRRTGRKRYGFFTLGTGCHQSNIKTQAWNIAGDDAQQRQHPLMVW